MTWSKPPTMRVSTCLIWQMSPILQIFVYAKCHVISEHGTITYWIWAEFNEIYLHSYVTSKINIGNWEGTGQPWFKTHNREQSQSTFFVKEWICLARTSRYLSRTLLIMNVGRGALQSSPNYFERGQLTWILAYNLRNNAEFHWNWQSLSEKRRIVSARSTILWNAHPFRLTIRKSSSHTSLWRNIPC